MKILIKLCLEDSLIVFIREKRHWPLAVPFGCCSIDERWLKPLGTPPNIEHLWYSCQVMLNATQFYHDLYLRTFLLHQKPSQLLSQLVSPLIFKEKSLGKYFQLTLRNGLSSSMVTVRPDVIRPSIRPETITCSSCPSCPSRPSCASYTLHS